MNKFFILIHEPGCVPSKKVPHPQTTDGVLDFVAECLDARSPWTRVTVVEVLDSDIQASDGGEMLEIAGRRRHKALIKRRRAHRTSALTTGRELLAALGDQHPALRSLLIKGRLDGR